MPYAFKAFCFLLIIFNVDLVCPVENCVKLRWNNTFNFSFYPNDISSFMQNKVRNFIRYCLENSTGETLRSCKKPAVEGDFPLISGAPNISLKMLRRPVLATKEASAGTAVQILHAFEEIWQLFVLCLLAAILSGILIWFFDHKANSGHFPNSFWSGIREGLWWAVVTMTTVGYGDKTPKSFLARAYASLWMIIGMLLMSTFTAQISSSITADGLSPLNEIFGSEIGVPLGSRQFFLKYCYGVKSVKEYSTETELLDSPQTGDVDKIWLFDCEAKVDFNFMIVDVLEEYTPSIGVGIWLTNKSIPAQNFTRCLEEWSPDMDDEEQGGSGIQDDLSGSGMKDGKSEMFSHGPESGMDNRDEPDRNCFDKYSRGKQRQQMKLASSQKHLSFMDYILLACGGVIIILLTIGSLWNISGKVRDMGKTADNNADIEKGGVLDIELGVKTRRELHAKELTVVSRLT